MQLITVATGSKGNTYLLQNENECLILDCGVPILQVKQAIDFNVNMIVGALVTHIHSDHYKYANKYEQMGIKVVKPFEDVSGENHYKLGNFEIWSFEVPHDIDVKCYGYLIHHAEIGFLLYITDWLYCKYNFKKFKVSNMLLACNHNDDITPENSGFKYQHVISGHSSTNTVKEFITKNKTPYLKNVVLCHISDTANKSVMYEQINSVLDDNTRLYIAKKGLVVNVTNIPF